MVPEPPSPSLCYGICYNFKKNEILAAKENGKNANEKVSHSISRVTYEYYEEDHMGPCVYKPGIPMHLLVSIDCFQLHVVMV